MYYYYRTKREGHIGVIPVRLLANPTLKTNQMAIYIDERIDKVYTKDHIECLTTGKASLVSVQMTLPHEW